MDIKGRVDSLIKRFETNCPFKIAKGLGVSVQFEELGSTLGYYTKFCRVPIIIINQSAEEMQKVFICGHELGHHVLHPHENTPFMKKHTFFSTDKIEVEAHSFSIELIFASKETITLADVESYGIPKQIALLKRSY